MLDSIFKLLYLAGAIVLILYTETLRGADWLFITVLTWIAIGAYCFIRFGIYGDNP